MPSRKTNLCTRVRAGMTVELNAPAASGLATVLEVHRSRLVVRVDGQPFPQGRVFVRVPLAGALLQASARLRPWAGSNTCDAALEDFTSTQIMERRVALRLEEPVGVRLALLDAPDGSSHILPALNVSVSGLLLGWPDAPLASLGERVEMRVVLDGAEIAAMGEVVRADYHRTAIRFTTIEETDQDRIAAYIFRRERDRRRLERPLETAGLMDFWDDGDVR